MSKKKLVFKVSQGLAVTGLALSVGTGCQKIEPVYTVNPTPPNLTNALPPAPAPASTAY